MKITGKWEKIGNRCSLFL